MLGRPFSRYGLLQHAAAAIYRPASHSENCFVTLLQPVAFHAVSLSPFFFSLIVTLIKDFIFPFSDVNFALLIIVITVVGSHGRKLNYSIKRRGCKGSIESQLGRRSFYLFFFLDEPTNAHGVSGRSTRKYARVPFDRQ